ncbi:hypothetical protein ACIA5D_09135 [Actinoplanes sp. NPDC051513]
MAQFMSGAGASPFTSANSVTFAYLGWSALWIALVLGLAGVALARRDL